MNEAAVQRRVGDYHVHTGWSDGEGRPDEVIAAAARLGLPELGFSDHLVPPSLDDGYGIPLNEVGDYVKAMRAAARRAAGPLVLVGVEVDYSPETWAETLSRLAEHRFDFLIGSVHSVDGAPFDLDARLTEERWPDVDVLFRHYYARLAELASSGTVDVIGHLDLPKKFGRPAGDGVREAEDEALSAIAAGGALLEINTAGLRNQAAEQYPALSLLVRARELGIRITFGSDAHVPRDVGAGLTSAVEVARAAGYASWVRLSDRKEVPLP